LMHSDRVISDDSLLLQLIRSYECLRTDLDGYLT